MKNYQLIRKLTVIEDDGTYSSYYDILRLRSKTTRSQAIDLAKRMEGGNDEVQIKVIVQAYENIHIVDKNPRWQGPSNPKNTKN